VVEVLFPRRDNAKGLLPEIVKSWGKAGVCKI
jgi:hypothetical protein